MTGTTVKICGLQDVEVLKSLIQMPVDYTGFIFAKSRRQVTAEQAAELIEVLHSRPSTGRPASVGVFLNPEREEIDEVLKRAPLDFIQLHGQESPAFCDDLRRQYGVKVIKVLSLDPGGSEAHALKLNSYLNHIDVLLLDTHDPVYGGGSGETFAWDQIPAYQNWSRSAGIPLMAAGGLTPENVQTLVQSYAPDGVDVSSGVESNGVKDIAKITAFVERVKGL
ncbi:phosphoribosylanthranilate isomerase [Paenibacillus sp. JX-17]|uniref:N-(5'-phosphoribosyl)anthranilate isomerase n=1 Tax=Paenibacillus lacisoli TaxID=3064525 RepID=A0ABT9CBK8_9BACL|nr:phosphoribosylanthranilate isomerase [Paenibacillus sp. JX-17]MDO7905066.1 phosphoribosylanthranilate isomerase [Paenibacillus sp. JX-17]